MLATVVTLVVAFFLGLSTRTMIGSAKESIRLELLDAAATQNALGQVLNDLSYSVLGFAIFLNVSGFLVALIAYRRPMRSYANIHAAELKKLLDGLVISLEQMEQDYRITSDALNNARLAREHDEALVSLLRTQAEAVRREIRGDTASAKRLGICLAIAGVAAGLAISLVFYLLPR